MVKVLYTLLYLLWKVGLKVAIKPKLSTYGTLFLQSRGSVWSAISVPAHGGEPVLRIIAHFWPSFERSVASRDMEYASLAQTTCKSSEIFKHRVIFS